MTWTTNFIEYRVIWIHQSRREHNTSTTPFVVMLFSFFRFSCSLCFLLYGSLLCCSNPEALSVVVGVVAVVACASCSVTGESKRKNKTSTVPFRHFPAVCTVRTVFATLPCPYLASPPPPSLSFRYISFRLPFTYHSLNRHPFARSCHPRLFITHPSPFSLTDLTFCHRSPFCF